MGRRETERAGRRHDPLVGALTTVGVSGLTYPAGGRVDTESSEVRLIPHGPPVALRESNPVWLTRGVAFRAGRCHAHPVVWHGACLLRWF